MGTDLSTPAWPRRQSGVLQFFDPENFDMRMLVRLSALFSTYPLSSVITPSTSTSVIIYTSPICLELFKFLSVAPQVSSSIWHRVLLYSC